MKERDKMNPKVSDAILFHLLFTIVMKTLFWSNTFCAGLATFHCSYGVLVSTKSEFWHEIQLVRSHQNCSWCSDEYWTPKISNLLCETRDCRTKEPGIRRKKIFIKIVREKIQSAFFSFSFFFFFCVLFVCLFGNVKKDYYDKYKWYYL